MSQKLLDNWTNEDFDSLEKGILQTNHNILETGLFDDAGLARLLDNHPDSSLSINTMGTNTNNFEWREGDRNGTSGTQLIELVRQGRFWLNLRSVHKHHPEVKQLIDGLYNELEANKPGFRGTDRSANLLVSSPQALVHYHIDTKINMLWHLRGRKRVWVYPPYEERFASDKYKEMCCAGDFTDEIPYDESFDKYALVFDVNPGQLLTWPQMTPHRVNNLEGLCVSLSSEHSNPRSARQYNMYLANRMLRNTMGRFCTSTSPDGFSAHLKNFVFRASRKLGSLTKRKEKEAYTYPISFKVDPSTPEGYTLIDLPKEALLAPHENEKLLQQ